MIELYTAPTPNGHKISIAADFATFPRVNIYEWSGVEIGNLGNLSEWFERYRERQGFKAGLNVPIRLNPANAYPEEAKKTTQNIIQK